MFLIFCLVFSLICSFIIIGKKFHIFHKLFIKFSKRHNLIYKKMVDIYQHNDYCLISFKENFYLFSQKDFYKVSSGYTCNKSIIPLNTELNKDQFKLMTADRVSDLFLYTIQGQYSKYVTVEEDISLMKELFSKHHDALNMISTVNQKEYILPMELLYYNAKKKYEEMYKKILAEKALNLLDKQLLKVNPAKAILDIIKNDDKQGP